jgi:hypothetical protein
MESDRDLSASFVVVREGGPSTSFFVLKQTRGSSAFAEDDGQSGSVRASIR